MRFKVDILLSKNEVTKGYRQALMSMMKSAFSRNNPEYFEQYFGKSTPKNYTFSVYLPGAKYTQDGRVRLSGNAITMYYSTSDLEHGLNYMEAMLMSKKNKEVFEYKGETFSVVGVRKIPEYEIRDTEVTFKTKSEILIRDSNFEEKRNLYYTLDEPENKGVEILKRNLISQIKNEIGLELSDEEVSIDILSHKWFNVWFYNGTVIRANKAQLRIKAPTQVLQHIYQVGLGSAKSSGFGMLEVVR